MKVNEHLLILFWLKHSKAYKDEMAPIYVRIIVDGDRDGFSSSKKTIPCSGTRKLAQARYFRTRRQTTAISPRRRRLWKNAITCWRPLSCTIPNFLNAWARKREKTAH